MILYLLSFLQLTLIDATADIVVTIPNGHIRGRKEFSLRNISFYAFQQIPYAKPPIDELRFQDPEPMEHWDGILDATQNTKFCYQQSNLYNVENLTAFETEDCLYLNIYTPMTPSLNNNFPVMFFIYGGGFTSGAANFDFFGPHYLMEKEVIVVTINYRVGLFGFLTTGDSIIPGNFGLKDQRLGLHWVQENIVYFGGDPNKVTIFGQSAGAASVSFHLMSKSSKGLFRAAIAQSGSVLSPWAFQRNYKDIAYTLAYKMNVNFNKTSSSKELLDFLRNVPARDLNEAAKTYPSDILDNQITDGFLFTPVVEPESDNAFISENMFFAIEKGHMDTVPLLIGICSEESITTANNMDDFFSRVTDFDLNTTKLVNPNMHLVNTDAEYDAGKAIRDLYTNGTLFKNNLGKAVRFYSDTSFSRGIIQHAHLQSQFSPVYFYQFSYYGEIIGDRPNIPGADRTGHSDDNYFLWTYFNASTLNEQSASDILMSERYRTLFTNFAKYLNPTPAKSELLDIIWPLVQPNNFQYLDINENLTIKTDPKGDVFGGWVQIYEKYAVKPYDTF